MFRPYLCLLFCI